MSRTCSSVALSLSAILAATSPALALEKTSRPAIEPEEAWVAGSSGTIRYYNNCTGWVWIWSAWAEGEETAVRFDLSFPVGALATSWSLTYSGVPSGYGYTGTISVRDGYGCASPVLASQPYLPPVTSGWNATFWGGLPVPQQFLLDIAWTAPVGARNPTGLASDHPAAGPTGPAACGLCFPTTRTVHSRYFGVGGAYCPSGTTLQDGTCAIEWMIDADVRITDIVTDRSWGRVKSLFR